MKVPWKYYAKRRGHNLTDMLLRNMFKTYEQYSNWCLAKGVEPTTLKEFIRHLPPTPPPIVKPKPKPISKPKPKPNSKPKRITSKKRKPKITVKKYQKTQISDINHDE
jgi:cell division septation protein DedD